MRPRSAGNCARNRPLMTPLLFIPNNLSILRTLLRRARLLGAPSFLARYYDWRTVPLFGCALTLCPTYRSPIRPTFFFRLCFLSVLFVSTVFFLWGRPVFTLSCGLCDLLRRARILNMHHISGSILWSHLGFLVSLLSILGEI